MHKEKLIMGEGNPSVDELKGNQRTSTTPFFQQDSHLKQVIRNHRELTRQKFSSPIKWPTIVAALPISFGLVQFFLTKTSDFNPDSFFRKTLPIFSTTSPKYNMETIEYILNSNTSSANRHKNFLLSQPHFVAQLKNVSTTNLKITSFLDFEKFTGLSSSFFDELPSYMQGLKQSFDPTSEFEQEKQDLDFISTHQWQKTSRSTPFQESSFLKKSQVSSSNLIIETSTEKETTIQCISSGWKEKGSPARLKNFFFKNRLELLKTEDQLSQQLEALFLDDEISLSTDLFQDQSFNVDQDFDEDDDSQETADSLLFNEFAKHNNSVTEPVLIDVLLRNSQNLGQFPVEKCRLLSGYIYPDMTSQDLLKFFQKKTMTQWFLKTPSKDLDNVQTNSIWVPTTGNPYIFRVKNLPQIKIQTHDVVVSERDTHKILYDGPRLVLDKKTAYDWKTSPSLRAWFYNYISPLNPFTQYQENFLGLFDSPKLSKDFIKKKLSELKNTDYFQEAYQREFPLLATSDRWFHTPPKRRKSLLNPVLSTIVLPDRRVFQIPITNKQGETVRTYTFPLLEIREPLGAFKKVGSKKHKKPFIGKIYSSRFDLSLTAKPDFQFPTECWNYMSSESSKVSGNQYFRSNSLFSNIFHKGFGNDTLWEPLTTQSWLLLCKISFGVLTFQFVKTFLRMYGREGASFILSLGSALGVFEKPLREQIERLLGQRKPGYRIISNPTKSFPDVIGFEKFGPELSELLLFLRNSGRDIGTISETLPRGVLLTGPPGTGKTLLVHALAGEARVPVIALSGSSLMVPGESAGANLDLVFAEARSHAPCIVFIDELDSLGERRSGLVYTPLEQDNGLVSDIVGNDGQNKKFGVLEQDESGGDDQEFQFVALEQNELGNSGRNSAWPEFQTPTSIQQISLLTKLLIKLDGMRARDGVIVFAATNRPEALDPALLRPGRFEKFIQVDVPSSEKRIEILQFYGKQRGWSENLPWDYLAARTVGLSAGDLATLMNESAMKAIMAESQHTLETIEHGIDKLTTSEIEKITPLVLKTVDGSKTVLPFSVSQKFEIVRLAYYQAAKVVVAAFLEHQPNSVVVSLWPRRPTRRSLQITANVRSNLFQGSRLYELQDRVVGCYAGKAAEFLFLQKFSTRRSSHLSTLGVEELLFAQKLSYILLEKIKFYSKKPHLQRSLSLAKNQNFENFEVVGFEKIDKYEDLLEKICVPTMQAALDEDKTEYKSKYDLDFDFLTPEFSSRSEQLNYSVPWWHLQLTRSAYTGGDLNPGNWTDFYLYNTELNILNVQWLPADTFYHTQTSLKYLRTALLNVKKRSQTSPVTANEKEKSYPKKKVNLPWNEVSNLTRDYPVHSLVSQSFNKAFKILNRNRALLDRLAITLISNEVIREPQINIFFKEFQVNTETLSTKQYQLQTSQAKQTLIEKFEKEKQVKIVEFSWGQRSRKVLPRWIDFSDFSISKD